MPVNLELKQKVQSLEKIRNLLKMIGAEYKGLLNQRDVYFNVSGSLLKLRVMDNCSELIKYNRVESGEDRWSDYSILTIYDEKAEDFFSSIFSVEAVVGKKRELWLYDNTRIHLDDVNDLGSFIELETLVLAGKDDALKRFSEIIRLLELNIKDQILMSYRDLILLKGTR